jgi:hypothetical protein
MSIVICVELSERSKSELDALVVQGSYKGYSEAVAVAISNQLVLQRGASGSHALILDSAIHPSVPNVTEAPSGAPSPPSKPLPSIPPGFSLSLAQSCQSEPAPFPDDVFVRGSKVTVDRWFFGQHNKLLPVKASCRALAVLMAEQPLGISISEAGSKIATEAAELGDYLRQLDVVSGAIREEALATAFPENGPDGDRSRLRYANQFIANLNAQKQLSGLLVDLKLVSHLRAKEPLLLLTETGLRLAKLSNPILDEPMRSNGVPRIRFSDDEISLLIQHIKDHVPVEDFAFRMVIGAIKEGANTPESLDEKLSLMLPPGKKKISEAFITTQRSGVISRMSDLDLILRRRDGIRVKYEATSRGNAYLSGQQGVEHER